LLRVLVWLGGILKSTKDIINIIKELRLQTTGLPLGTLPKDAFDDLKSVRLLEESPMCALHHMHIDLGTANLQGIEREY